MYNSNALSNWTKSSDYSLLLNHTTSSYSTINNQSATDDVTSLSPTTEEAYTGSSDFKIGLTFFLTLCSISFYGLTLNVYVLLVSFTKQTLGGFKYLIILIGLNNVIIGVSTISTIVLQIYSILSGDLFGFHLSAVIITIVIEKVLISVSVFQMVFTLTKLYAVVAPLSFHAHFSKQFYMSLAVWCFVSYNLAAGAIAILLPSTNGQGSHFFVTTAMLFDALNMAANFVIIIRLRFAIISYDADMRETVRANLWQSIIPFMINAPFQLAYVVVEQVQTETGWVRPDGMRRTGILVGYVYILSVWSNLVVDPICVLRCITIYQQQLMQSAVCVRGALFTFSVVMAGIILIGISGFSVLFVSFMKCAPC